MPEISLEENVMPRSSLANDILSKLKELGVFISLKNWTLLSEKVDMVNKKKKLVLNHLLHHLKNSK